MGCFNSKTKKKDKDTLSQKGAAEDQRLSRQNNTALPAVDVAVPESEEHHRDAAQRSGSTELSVPIPNEASVAHGERTSETNAAASQERKVKQAEEAERKEKEEAARAARPGSPSRSSSTPDNTRTGTSTTAVTTSVSSVSSRKHKHGSQSPSITSQARRDGPLDSIPFDADVDPNAPRLRPASLSGSSMSIAFQSNSSQAVIEVRPTSSATADKESIYFVSPSRQSVSNLNADGQENGGEAAGRDPQDGDAMKTHTSVVLTPSEHGFDQTAITREEGSVPVHSLLQDPVKEVSGLALAPPSALSSRLYFEPYSESRLRDGTGDYVGEETEVDGLPPYEWVPRTAPVPSAMRRRNANTTVVADTWGTPLQDRHFDEHARVTQDVGAAEQEAYEDDTRNLDDPSSFLDGSVSPVRYPDPTHSRTYNAISPTAAATPPPLAMRTFYPHLPSAQWPSNAASLSIQAPHPPHKRSATAATAPLSELYEDEEDWQDDYEQYGDESEGVYCAEDDALYSPADPVPATYLADRVQEPRAFHSPALVDAYVAEEAEGNAYTEAASYHNSYTHQHTAQPSSLLESKSPRISVLSSSATPGLEEGWHNGRHYSHNHNFPRGHADGTGIGNAVGVGAHQYKPVTYLFDSSADAGVSSLRFAQPLQSAYATAADLW